MKPVENLIKDNLKNLKPCVHGGDVLDAASKSGLRREEILDFSSSVNPLGPSKMALEAAEKSFKEIPAYPDSNCLALRQAIANHFSGIGKNNVVVGNGSTELIYLFAEAFLKKGEVALIPAPTFGEYETAVRKTGETVKFVELDENFNFDPDVFIHKMAGAKIVFLCNPNNPTSILIPNKTLTGIVERALEQDSLVFLDEDFLEFVENEKKLSLIRKIKNYPNLFILRSFTKIFGLTGLRVGYGIASEEIINVLSCAKIPWNVNCLAQAAAVAALKDEEHLRVTRELIKKEKTRLLTELGRFRSLKAHQPDANFLFIDTRESGLTATELANKLLHEGILIRDCTSFRGLDQYFIRVAVKTRSENDRLIEALKRTVKNHN
ncbi:MAG TPA: threonine-phosphate decarboxylase CobD [Candidatus Limnocylindrales bacterium]|nr:threonine-phosphate decarboxylase CobD [Candidatus Limnocylindrales bacterium]